MIVYQTNKLFYGKYPYRVETVIAGAARLNFWGADKTIAFLRGDIHLNHWEKFSDNEKDNLCKFAELLKKYKELGVKTRAEWETMNLYCSDVNIYRKMQKDFTHWVYSISEPANNTDLDKLSSNPSHHLCKHLPHNRYTHKVVLRSNMPHHQRLKFMGWLENYKDSIKPSKGTVKWLQGSNQYLQDPFVYLDNPRQLTLVGMFLGNDLRKVQEFVLQDA